MTTYWLVWDGAAHWVAAELLRRGALPALARLGGITGLTPSSPSCQTPAGLATLFTGEPPARTGVTGFFVPGGKDGDPGGYRPGFAPGVCRVPPLWHRLGGDGVTSVLVHAPWAFGTGDPGPHVLGAVEAYSRRVARERVATLAPGESAEWTDLPAAVTVHRPGDAPTVTVTAGGDGVEAGERWVPFGGAWYRTVVLADSVRVVRTGSWSARVAGQDPDLAAGLREGTDRFPFVGDSLGALYRAGHFGPPMTDGAAEEVFLSAAELVAGTFRRAARTALTAAADLVVVYVPVTDDLGHELIGLLDHERAWEVLARGYRLADGILGDVLDAAGPADTVLVTADHGMVPVTSTFYPNNVLVEAGLAVPHAVEGADPGRSAVYYHVVNNGMVMRGNGSEADLERAVEALRADPAVEAVTTEGGATQLIFASGILPSADVTADRARLGPPKRSAAHVTNNGDPRLDAVFAAAGPTVRYGDGPGPANTGVAGFVARSIRAAAHARSNAARAQIRLCVVGRSGAGKSTFYDFASEFAEERGLHVARRKLAAPLYALQQTVRTAAGVDLPEDRQDQLLMESLAGHLRRLNPNALVEPFLAGLDDEKADLVINDDLRDPFVDLPGLRAHGFEVVLVQAADDVRHTRLGRRGDVTTSDASTSHLDHIDPLWTLVNEGSLPSYRRQVRAFLEVLCDSHR